MTAWKRRMAVLVAVAAGVAGLMMSTASAQTPPEFPEFSIPDFSIPGLSIPTTLPTIPPPTMPPPSSSTTTPPPTMPPSTIPFPDVDDSLERFFDDLITRFEEGGEIFDNLRALIDAIIADFGN